MKGAEVYGSQSLTMSDLNPNALYEPAAPSPPRGAARRRAESLHRAELTPVERDDQIAEWSRLMKAREERDNKLVQLEPVSTKAVGGRGKKGGVRQAARDLGLTRSKVLRAEEASSLR